MADTFNENGLTLSTTDELIDQLKQDFQNIYGVEDDINFDSETPDGQLIHLLAQKEEVVREMISNINISFDPDQAYGNVLDQRVKLNNIVRKAGSFSTLYVDITVNQTITLAGLDENFTNTKDSGYVVTDYDGSLTGYTVQDNAGTLWYLVNTTTLVQGTTTSCLFRAKERGAVESIVGTITTPVTVVAGVTNIINTQAQLTIGTARESDTELKIRRRRSVSYGGQNSCDSIEATVLNIDGITDCRCYENYGQNTDIPQKDGEDIDLHSIWLVVTGTGSADAIAEALYNKNGYARPMTGDIEHIYTNPLTKRVFYAKWDNAKGLPIKLRYTAKMTGLQKSIGSETIVAIKETIVNTSVFNINTNILASDYSPLIQNAMDNNGVIGAVPLDIQFAVDSVATISQTVGESLTNLILDKPVFEAEFTDFTGIYNFTFDGTDWKNDSDETIDLETIGIDFEGTPEENDVITVDYTEAGEWVSYINGYWDKIFTLHEDNITITVV